MDDSIGDQSGESIQNIIQEQNNLLLAEFFVFNDSCS